MLLSHGIREGFSQNCQIFCIYKSFDIKYKSYMPQVDLPASFRTLNGSSPIS